MGNKLDTSRLAQSHVTIANQIVYAPIVTYTCIIGINLYCLISLLRLVAFASNIKD